MNKSRRRNSFNKLRLKDRFSDLVQIDAAANFELRTDLRLPINHVEIQSIRDVVCDQKICPIRFHDRVTRPWRRLLGLGIDRMNLSPDPDQPAQGKYREHQKLQPI